MADANTPPQTSVGQDAPEAAQRTGPALVGALLVAIGVVMLAERTDALPVEWRTSVWPGLLMVLGAARLVQPTHRGREGLFLLLAGAWWYAGLAGWLSLVTTWPVLVIAMGASVVLQGLTAPRDPRLANGVFRRRHSGAMSWVLMAILAGALLNNRSGHLVSNVVTGADGAFHVASVMGESEHHLEGPGIRNGDVWTVMGKSSLDLRAATVDPGAEVTIDGLTLMGTSIIRVPDDWSVELKTVAAVGRVRDDRSNAAFGRDRSGTSDPGRSGPAPRLVVRGAVVMGSLIVR